MPGNDARGSWDEYQRLVLAEIERHDRWLTDLTEKHNAHSLDLNTLKLKAGMWGLAAGSIPAIGALLFMLLSKLLN